MHAPPVLVVDDLIDAADTTTLLLARWGYSAEALAAGSRVNNAHLQRTVNLAT